MRSTFQRTKRRLVFTKLFHDLCVPGQVIRIVGGELITPDPERSVDFLVQAPHWLEPLVTRRLVARVLPGARLATGSADWVPPETLDTAALNMPDAMTTAEFHALSAAASSFDAIAMSSPIGVDGYAIVADLDHGMDGEVEVLVRFAATTVPSVADQPWAEHCVTYEVRWSYPDPQEHERRLPSDEFLQARRRAAPILATVARSLVEATSGVVTDEDGFWVDRYSL